MIQTVFEISTVFEQSGLKALPQDTEPSHKIRGSPTIYRA